METALLVLLLGQDPTAQASTVRLERLLSPTLVGTQVLSATAAEARLAATGITSADLAANPNLGAVLTKSQKDLALVLVRPVGNGDDPDTTLDAITMVGGVNSPFTAIATSGTEARHAVVRGIGLALAGLRDPSDRKLATRLANMAQRAEWQALLGEVPGSATAATPHQRYYRILALSRLNRVVEARSAVAEFRRDFPDHLLSTSAAELVPNEVLDRSDGQLKDSPLPGDDGSNVLR